MPHEQALTLTAGDARLAQELTSAETLSGGLAVWQSMFEFGSENPTLVWRRMIADQAIAEYVEMEEKDGHYGAQLETRKESVLSKPRRVTPASDAVSDMRVAEFIEDVLDGLADFDNALYELMDALGKGVSIAEIMYERAGSEIRPVELRFRPQQAFAFNESGNPPSGPLRIARGEEILPANKFVVHSFRPHLGNRWGRPLARRCFWPSWFKRQDIKFWLKFVEKGTGTVLAKYPAGSKDSEKALALTAAEAVNDETAVAISESFAVDILGAARQGGTGVYKALAEDYANAEISKVVLGQILTSSGSDQGSGSLALGQVHNEVRKEKTEVDARSLMRVINQQLIRPAVLLNFGPNVDRPRWVIDFEEGEDLGKLAERDERLVGVGVDLPLSYFHERYQIPVPEKGEPVAASTGAAASAEGGEFAEPGEREGRRIVAQGVAEAKKLYAEWIETLIEQATKEIG